MIVRIDAGHNERLYVKLARSFPVLFLYAPGVTEEHVDLHLVDAWAAHDKDPNVLKWIDAAGRAPFPGDGARCAARFILNLWSTRQPWKCGPFDLFAAMR